MPSARALQSHPYRVRLQAHSYKDCEHRPHDVQTSFGKVLAITSNRQLLRVGYKNAKRPKPSEEQVDALRGVTHDGQLCGGAILSMKMIEYKCINIMQHPHKIGSTRVLVARVAMLSKATSSQAQRTAVSAPLPPWVVG